MTVWGDLQAVAEAADAELAAARADATDATFARDAAVVRVADLEAQVTALIVEGDEARGQVAALTEERDALLARIVELETPPDPGILPYWGAPAWRDEFDGAEVGEQWWNLDGAVGYDWSVSRPAQATVADSVLRLRAERIPALVTADGKTRTWKSAHLTTRNKFSQRYGRWEIRCQLPTTWGDSSGLWPSFWLRDNTGGGEVDIFESWGTPSLKKTEDPYLRENAHWNIHEDTAGGKAKAGPRAWLPRLVAPFAPRTTDGFHVYACEWTPEAFKFFFDGTLVGSAETTIYSWLRTSFPTKANIRLHYAVGQNYYGEPTTATKSPADYLIDYVRVYALPGS